MVKSTARSRFVRFALPALALAALASAPTAFEGRAAAQKKPARGKPACDLHNVPLYAGASWTYKSGPDEMKIEVDSVGPGKDADGAPVTIIKVDETYKGETNKLEWTCSPKGLRVPLESFFFTGEAGGLWGASATVTKHDDVWMHPDAEVIAGSGWSEKVKADVKRTDMGGRAAAHADAKIEVERFPTVQGPDAVIVPAGSFDVVKVTFELRGRAFIGEDKTEMVIDDKNPGVFWIKKDLGIVKYEDALKTRRTWELIATTVPLP